MTDTGPPYPPPPGAGSNAIGSFVIGESEIGAIPPFDIWETVQSQYANSPIITTLLTNFADFIDPTANIEQFFDLVMNLDTAQGYGLDVWGRIVGIDRYLNIPNPDKFFGFDEGYPSYEGWTVAPFYNGQTLTTVYKLADVPFRKLILAKALSNICDGSIPAINQVLITLFGNPRRGNAYVTEGPAETMFFGFAESTTALGFNNGQFYDGSASFETMLMTYTFNFQLTPVDEAIVLYSNVLPKPTGVKAEVRQIF
jgi:hypothetical protein